MEREMKTCIREITAAMRNYGFAKILNRTISEKIIPSNENDVIFFSFCNLN